MTHHTPDPVSLAKSLATFSEQWSPRIVGQVNDYDVRVAKVDGEYVWHSHTDTDEFFLVVEGCLTIGLRDEAGPGSGDRSVTLEPGHFFVVPAGVEHRPAATTETSILMFERTGTLTTGDYTGDVPEHIDSTVGMIV